MHLGTLVFTLAVQELLLDPTSRVAICLTAKVANSQIGDFVRWLRVGPPRVCEWRPSFVNDWEKACRAACVIGGCTRLKRPEPPPLQSCRYQRFGRWAPDASCARQLLRPPWRMVVPVRDPYTKLLSAFHSKLFDSCDGSEACLQRYYLPSVRAACQCPTA